MTDLDKTSRAAQFIIKLLQLTQEKKIDWAASPSPRDDGRTAFVADVEGKTLRLYQHQQPTDEFSDTGVFFPPRKGRMVDVTCLEILDSGLVTYTFEGLSGLSDLYDSAAYSGSNVEALIDAILEKA